MDNQSICIKNKESVTVSGLKKLESLTETEFILDTLFGKLSITGSKLEMSNLNNEAGEITIVGEIDSVKYHKSNKVNILSKLFK